MGVGQGWCRVGRGEADDGGGGQTKGLERSREA